MFESRMHAVVTVTSMTKDVKFDIRKRHKFLLEQEGWYDAKQLTSDVYPFTLKALVNLHSKTKVTTNFTRWCSKNELLTSEQISAYGKISCPERFKLTCRHNDFLRMSDTNHFNSCFGLFKVYAKQVTYFLTDPDYAMVYTVDASGKFKARCLLKLLLNTACLKNSRGEVTQYVYLVFPFYGNANFLGILNRLNETLPLVVSKHKSFKPIFDNTKTLTLPSVTLLNNIKVAEYDYLDVPPTSLITKDNNNVTVRFRLSTNNVLKLGIKRFKFEYEVVPFDFTKYVTYLGFI